LLSNANEGIWFVWPDQLLTKAPFVVFQSLKFLLKSTPAKMPLLE
jgi:hypothetical protein